MASINYLFPPDKINELPTWRFVLHFKVSGLFRKRKIRKAIKTLQVLDWKIINSLSDLDDVAYDPQHETVGISVEVPPARRKRANSLADYESDVWKIMGYMIECGFGDMFYEAVDWKE